MARRRSNSGGGVVGFVIIALIALVASIPMEVWLVVAGLAVVALIVWALKRSSESPSVAIAPPNTIRQGRRPGPQSADIAVAVSAPAATSYDIGRRIPAPPSGELTRAKWLSAGESFDIAGFHVNGGMVYVGLNLIAANGRQEPALINPNLRVSRESVDISVRRTQYWPSYSDLDPQARRAYLQWLASGRRDPSADIGYVFLFFYGLERRALVDLDLRSSGRTEIDGIVREVQELLAVYDKNPSFHFYATNFLAFVSAAMLSGESFVGEPPDEPSSYELPLGLRIGLGKLATAKKPVSSAWALRWALADPTIGRRTPVQRCRTEFEKIFLEEYARIYGAGLVLPINKTKLKVTYRPASGGFAGGSPYIDLGDIPDVTAITGPQKKLQLVVDSCTAELEKYSRYLGKNGRRGSLEGALLLPVSLWPDSLSKAVRDTANEIEQGESTATWGGLVGRFGSTGNLTRADCVQLQSKLEELGIGIEPDVIGGAKTPASADPIVLFACPERDAKLVSSGAYQAASLMVDLGAMTAAADGDVAEHEFNLLKGTIDSWKQLDDHCRRRLVARLQLQITKPLTVASVKKRLDLLSSEARRTVADVMVMVARADEVITPDEVKLLEKMYKLLQLDPKLVYSDLHGGSTRTEEERAGFVLDPARVAKLQEETAKISSVLREVFAEEPTSQEVVQEEPEKLGAASFLGLDSEHARFARLLLSRTQWARNELIDAANDLELMLDGALERINDAALNSFEMPLTEGDDPVEINKEVLEKAFA